jgi:hypothetical protein
VGRYSYLFTLLLVTIHTLAILTNTLVLGIDKKENNNKEEERERERERERLNC